MAIFEIHPFKITVYIFGDKEPTYSIGSLDMDKTVVLVKCEVPHRQ